MRRSDYLLTFLGALMLAMSRTPLHLGWLVFFAWIPFLVIFERGFAKPRQLIKLGAITSVVYVLIVYYWFSIVTVPGLIGMLLLFVVVYWLFFLAIHRIYASLPRFRYLGFICVMLTFEYIQNYGETRFPWFNIAYSLADYNVLVQIADLIGVMGISLLIMVVNVLIFRIRKNTLSSAIALLLIFSAWFGYGVYCLKTIELKEHDAGIYVMQPSIDQDVKWEPEQYGKSMQLFRKLTLQAAADSAKLVIYPEGAVTDYLAQRPSIREDMQAIIDTARVDVFTGFPDYSAAPIDYPGEVYHYNAASLVQQDGTENVVYHKNILVPVAERMLFLDIFPFLWKLQLGQANWEFGTELAFYESGGYRFSPSICYELAFPDIFHRMTIPRDAATKKLNKCDYHVNLTNDAWLGTSYGPWLHAMMTRFRAVENRIQIYRCANTGISLIVDPKGKILQKTRLYEVKNITAPLYTTPRIPFIRHIYKYPWGLVFIALALLIIAIIKKPERLL